MKERREDERGREKHDKKNKKQGEMQQGSNEKNKNEIDTLENKRQKM